MVRPTLFVGLLCLILVGCGGGASTTEGLSPGSNRDVRYLFDSQGQWIALQAGNLIYDRSYGVAGFSGRWHTDL